MWSANHVMSGVNFSHDCLTLVSARRVPIQASGSQHRSAYNVL